MTAIAVLAASPLAAYFPLWSQKNPIPHVNIVKVIAADFNGDERPDVVVRTSTHQIYVYLSNADGTLASPAKASYNATYLTSLAAGDVDGNGTVDVIVSSTAPNSLMVFPGNGDGTLGTPISTALNESPTAIAASDFNEDGKLDVAVRSFSAATLRVYAGDGAGQFSEASSIGLNENATHLETGDVDHDGHADLALAYSDSHPYELYFGRGDGTLETAVNVPSPGTNSTRMLLADLDDDQDLEILVADNYPANTLTVFVNLGSRAFAAPVVYDTVGSPSNPYDHEDPLDLAAGDADGDGRTDVLVTLVNSFALATFPGNGNGSLRPPRFGVAPGVSGYTSNYPKYIATGDFNADGRLDVAISASKTLGVLVNRTGETSIRVFAQAPTITQGQTAPFYVIVDPHSDTRVFNDAPDPEGTITLFNNGVEVGRAALAHGVVVLEAAGLPLGTQTVTAEYSGSDEYLPVTSAPVTQNVIAESTTTTLTSDPSGEELRYGDPFRVIARVTSPLQDPLDGNFALYVNGVRAHLGGRGPLHEWNLTPVPPGRYEYFVRFEGTQFQPPSQSSVLTRVIKKATTTTIIRASSLVHDSEPAYFSVELTSPTTNQVQRPVKVYDGATLIKTIEPNRHLTLSLPVGIHYLRAVFEGDANYEGSESPVFEYRVVSGDGLILDAAATTATTITVLLSHSRGTGTSHYRYYRRIGSGPWVSFSTYSNVHTEQNVQAGVAYMYRAERYGYDQNLIATSNTDVAMVGTFTDHPLLAGMTAKSVHLTELVAATNVFRAAGGLAPISINAGAGQIIRADHVLSLRTAINHARVAVGMPAVAWTDTIAPGGILRAAHVMELRYGIR